jgi:hypothetical protein
MTRLNLNALFASALQRSDAPAAEAVAEAVSRTVRQSRVGGCASRKVSEEHLGGNGTVSSAARSHSPGQKRRRSGCAGQRGGPASRRLVNMH